MSGGIAGYRLKDALMTGEIGGNIAAYLEAITGERSELAANLTMAVHDRGRALRDALRAQVRDNFGKIPKVWRPKSARGQNLEKAVRDRRYPSSRATLGPASLVYIPWRLAQSFTAASFIRARGGNWLAIPTPEAIKRGYAFAEESRGTRGKFQEGNRSRIARIGKAARAFGTGGYALRFVRLKPDVALLGIDGADWDEIGIKRSAKQRRKRLIVLFVLVRQVVVPQRLDIDALAERAMDGLYGDLSELSRD